MDEFCYILNYNDGMIYKVKLPTDIESDSIVDFLKEKGFDENYIYYMISCNDIDNIINID